MAVKNNILLLASIGVIFLTIVGKILRSDHTASLVLSGCLYTV
jgi:hypothetical protein